MATPTRLSVTTFNLWGEQHWPERGPVLLKSLESIGSDVYLFQAITPSVVEFLDANLPNYKRVSEDNGRVGWITECNIYWNTKLLTLVDHGFGELEMADHPNRGLFWVRLYLNSNPRRTVFLSTTHFPWVGCEAEKEQGVNQRIPASAKVCEHFRRLIPPEEIAIFGGDFNDDFHPLRILSEEMGLIDVFECLDLPPPVTHPVRPSNPVEEGKPDRSLDWIVCTLPSQCRVVAAFAKTSKTVSFPPPSDHLPVVAVFEVI